MSSAYERTHQVRQTDLEREKIAFRRLYEAALRAAERVEEVEEMPNATPDSVTADRVALDTEEEAPNNGHSSASV
jgi:hypothetical protein